MKPVIAMLTEQMGGSGSGESSGAKGEAQQKTNQGMKSGGKVSFASKRADGIAVKGKTKGRIV